MKETAAVVVEAAGAVTSALTSSVLFTGATTAVSDADAEVDSTTDSEVDVLADSEADWLAADSEAADSDND